MILVDSSVWIAHLKKSNRELTHLLKENQVIIHPFIIGELACGIMKRRREFLSLLNFLPACHEASHAEVLELVDRFNLFGKGVGWIDLHLLASCLLSSSKLWTLDKKLNKICSEMKLS